MISGQHTDTELVPSIKKIINNNSLKVVYRLLSFHDQAKFATTNKSFQQTAFMFDLNGNVTAEQLLEEFKQDRTLPFKKIKPTKLIYSYIQEFACAFGKTPKEFLLAIEARLIKHRSSAGNYAFVSGLADYGIARFMMEGCGYGRQLTTAEIEMQKKIAAMEKSRN